MAPGGSTRIGLKINTAKMKKKRKYTKNATITTNDPSKPTSKLFMSGMVKKVIDWTPSRLSFSALAGSEAEGNFEIFVPESDIKVKLKSLTAKKHKVEVTDFQPNEDGTRWAISVSAGASDNPKSLRDSLEAVVEVDGKRTLTIPIPVTIKYRDLIEVTPRRTVTFNKKDTAKLRRAGEPITKELFVKTTEKNTTFKVTGVELSGLPAGLFDTRVSEVEEGSAYKIEITLKEYVAKRYLRGQLKIHTDHPSAPEKVLRVFARFESTPTGSRGR